MDTEKPQRIRGYYTYFFGDTHEPPDERPPIPNACPVDDPASVSAEDRKRMFRLAQYPYAARMRLEDYYDEKFPLQIEMVKMQNWVKETGQKVIILFEGRDAAGKGGTIRRFMEHLNPRGARVVALEVPSDVERHQWYFQRYVAHFPSAGEIVLFDRSWYNRAGVEKVMGFCTEQQYWQFLQDVPVLERIWVRNDIRLIKLYFSVNPLEQQRRFSQREVDPLKQWKLSPVDVAARAKWDEYTTAKEIMFERTHTDVAPWIMIKSDDKMRGRINAMRYVLNVLPYTGKDESVVRSPDPLIVASADEVFDVGSPKAGSDPGHNAGSAGNRAARSRTRNGRRSSVSRNVSS
ncbi:MAG: polyphosphate kinase 2 [Chloroflexi bacterium]|nr:polyphosphate kinase 2 [Chloroflexota bacterium]